MALAESTQPYNVYNDNNNFYSAKILWDMSSQAHQNRAIHHRQEPGRARVNIGVMGHRGFKAEKQFRRDTFLGFDENKQDFHTILMYTDKK